MAAVLKHKSFQQAIITLKSPWLLQVRFVSVPRIRAKPDRALDEITDRDKILRPFFRIMDIITCQENLAIKMRRLGKIQWQFGIKNKKLTLAAFMKRYPNIFIVYTDPMDGKQWCKFTPEFMALVDEEREICKEMESHAVQTLRRLLMMAAAGRICADNLQAVRRIFGFPHDFLDRFIPDYPQFFKLAHIGESTYVELVEWDESLALSEFEKKAKQDAMSKGMGDIEVRGQPLPFKILLSPGMALRKKNLEVLENWQKLPYISPYEDWTLVKKGTPLSEKRLVSLMHEFLSLTIEKKARLKVIQPFRDEFGLSQKINHLFERFPGIFYTSLRGGIKTIMLREAYEDFELLQEHPLIRLKEKFVEMVNAGPRLREPKVVGEHTDGYLVDKTEDADLSESCSESVDKEDTSEAEGAEQLQSECSCTDDCVQLDSEGDMETISSKT